MAKYEDINNTISLLVFKIEVLKAEFIKLKLRVIDLENQLEQAIAVQSIGQKE